MSARSNNGIGLAGQAGGWHPSAGCYVVGLRAGYYVPGPPPREDIPQGLAARALDDARVNGIRVVNMSFNYYGGTPDEGLPSLKAAVDRANGIVVMVASSGNGWKGEGDVRPAEALPAPARWNGVIAVGASLYGTTISNELRWSGSNYDSVYKKLSVVSSVGQDGISPGILPSTRQGGTYSTIGKTSAAAPQVTALAALILSLKSNLTPSQIKTIIESTAEKIGPYTYIYGRADEVGYGRINAYKALKYTLENYGGTITQNVMIPSGETWNVSPGVTWTFSGYYKLRVQGTLNASYATFRGSGYPGSWFGIEFYNAPSGQNLSYCTIKDAAYGLNFINTYAGFSRPTIRDNTFGVNCTNYSGPTFTATVFQLNGWGVYGDATSTPYLGAYLGYNSFRTNDYYDIYSTYPGTIYARGNWWGA